mgnify:CR=1 FL=1
MKTDRAKKAYPRSGIGSGIGSGVGLGKRALEKAVRESALAAQKPSKADKLPPDGIPDREEWIVEKNGEIRQAGADGPGLFAARLRPSAERSLYVFCKGVLGYKFLSARLHLPVCDWLQRVPPRRKLLLMPREHGKSALVARGMPVHILVQPRDCALTVERDGSPHAHTASCPRNLYFQTEDGCDQRVVLGCASTGRAKSHLRFIMAAFARNKILRALWPHRCWQNPRVQSNLWNAESINIPRNFEHPDPSIVGLGLDSPVAGAHPSVLVKDDLIELRHLRSPSDMQFAKDWHKLSRALITNPRSLEYTNGTRWSADDLYNEMLNDPTVEPLIRAVIENGEPIWPEKYSLSDIETLKATFGSHSFSLQFMNSYSAPGMVDFPEGLFRFWKTEWNKSGTNFSFVTIAEDLDREARLSNSTSDSRPSFYGQPLTNEIWDQLYGKNRSIGGLSRILSLVPR